MPLTVEELESIEVKPWESISDAFRGGDLLLGNGFSLTFSPSFSYGSLFEDFVNRVPEEMANLFRALDTVNFETLQEILLNAEKVNGILGLDTSKIREGVEILRTGLVETIQANHPRSSDLSWEKFKSVSEVLDQFEDIYTTSYDLLPYHIIMVLKDRHQEDTRVRPYNDYFWSGYSGSFLEFMDYQNYRHYKHIYYVHGALFLFPGASSGHWNDLKLRRGATTQLVEEVGRMILQGKLPLFVSEGRSEDKMNVIRHSPYLSFAYNKLRGCRDKVVVFGHSLSQQDDHIVDAIKRPSKDLAVGVYVGSRTLEEIEREIRQFRIKLAMHDIVFFDASTLF